MLPAWLMPGAPPEAAPSRLVGAPRLSASSRVRTEAASSGCTALVSWHLKAVARNRGADGELTLAQLTERTRCKASEIGSCLVKLQEKGVVKATSDKRGRAYRWRGEL